MRKEKYIKVKKYKGNTYFTVQFQYGSEHNKHTYSKTFNSADYDTPVQALNAACDHRDIKRAELLTSGLPTYRMTVNEAWEEYKRTHPRAEGTVRRNDSYYHKYVEPEFGNKFVADISEWDISTHLESMRYECSSIVINNVYFVWKALLSAAKGKKAIANIPLPMEAPASAVKKEPRKQDYSDEDMEKVINYLTQRKQNDNDETFYNRYIIATMIKVCRYTGLRPREIKNITKEDIDFQTGTIHIRPNGTDNIKTFASIRSVPMNSVVKSELIALCSLSRYEYPFAFCDGRIPTSLQISKCISNTSKKVGIKGFHLYGMRHSFDSELITSGVDPRTVMELMGHTSVSTTLATYARSNEEKRREAIEKVENSRKSA